MIEICQVNKSHIGQIRFIANSCRDIIAPNNKMIYYLCCTVFSKFSFIAFKDNQPVGFIFSMLDAVQQSIWIHQIAVIPTEQGLGIGSKLLGAVEKALESNKRVKPNQIRLAVKQDNHKAKDFYNKFNYQNMGTEDIIRMEIFCKKMVQKKKKLKTIKKEATQ